MNETAGVRVDVDDPRDQDEFDRIAQYEEIEKTRLLYAQYEAGLAYCREQIEKRTYRIGRLDERLGGGS